MDDFTTFFKTALNADQPPYPYQLRLATDDWPDLLDIPTGLGKTAAVVLAWLYKRHQGDPATPRRLVYCLPMRVLVEQTHDNIIAWLKRHDCYATSATEAGVSVHRLMGGEADIRSWVEHPERDMILIGTQDMLLSRALMRGYGMSRYRWPIDFALLHNDALWVFDEIQLMGAGLPTSTQLEAFRRLPEMPGTARSLWVSATLNPQWFRSIDFRPHFEGLRTLTLDEQEKRGQAVAKRREAVKRLRKSDVTLDTDGAKAGAREYLSSLADEVLSVHEGNAPTLIILNNVQRSQGLHRELSRRFRDSDAAPELVLVHSRYRQAERSAINRRILGIGPSGNVIVIATQAIEAGVDISSRHLFTELAPWPSLVQRFGRCNRAGEYAEAQVHWIDIADEKQAAPYTGDELAHAREILRRCSSVAAADLPPVESEFPLYQVIRRKDFLDLFNTDPDLSGFDIDISPWIRDGGTPPVWVYWREFDESPDEEGAPRRDELCPVSIGQIKAHLTKVKKKRDKAGFTWDALARQWRARTAEEIRPGMTLLLRCSDGGYDPVAGFIAGHLDKKHPLTALEEMTQDQSAYDDDRRSIVSRAVTLAQHLADVRDEAVRLCEAVGETEYESCIRRAAQWHDTGKAHRAFQTMLLLNDARAAEREGQLWAKGETPGKSCYAVCGGVSGYTERPHFRHELASLLAWLEHGERDEHHDLIAYLIAAHHGKVRMGLRALPDEQGPGDARRFARGVWEGDTLPALTIGEMALPETRLRLDVMELGDGAMGASWSTRTQRLLQELGPFRLAWLETLVRLADWRASARYSTEGSA